DSLLCADFTRSLHDGLPIARHQNGAHAIELGVDRFRKAGGIAVVQIHLVLAGDLLEGRHRNVDLVAGVFGHVRDLATGNAALLIDHLHVVADTGVNAHARKGEHATHRYRTADNDLAALLRLRKRRERQAQAEPDGCGPAPEETGHSVKGVTHALLLTVECETGPLSCGTAKGERSAALVARLRRGRAVRR